MRSGEIRIEQESAGDTIVVRVHGSVGIENSPDLRDVLRQLVEKKTPAVVVSTENADYVDTSGLATLVECAEDMRRYGGKLLVAGLRAEITDAFSLAQLAGVLPLSGTEADAVAELKGQKQGEAEAHQEEDAAS